MFDRNLTKKYAEAAKNKNAGLVNLDEKYSIEAIDSLFSDIPVRTRVHSKRYSYSRKPSNLTIAKSDDEVKIHKFKAKHRTETRKPVILNDASSKKFAFEKHKESLPKSKAHRYVSHNEMKRYYNQKSFLSKLLSLLTLKPKKSVRIKLRSERLKEKQAIASTSDYKNEVKDFFKGSKVKPKQEKKAVPLSSTKPIDKKIKKPEIKKAEQKKTGQKPDKKQEIKKPEQKKSKYINLINKIKEEKRLINIQEGKPNAPISDEEAVKAFFTNSPVSKVKPVNPFQKTNVTIPEKKVTPVVDKKEVVKPVDRKKAMEELRNKAKVVPRKTTIVSSQKIAVPKISLPKVAMPKLESVKASKKVDEKPVPMPEPDPEPDPQPNPEPKPKPEPTIKPETKQQPQVKIIERIIERVVEKPTPRETRSSYSRQPSYSRSSFIPKEFKADLDKAAVHRDIKTKLSDEDLGINLNKKEEPKEVTKVIDSKVDFVKTTLDDLLNLISENKSITAKDAAEKLKTTEKEVLEWASYLEDSSLIELEYKPIGPPAFKIKKQEEWLLWLR